MQKNTFLKKFFFQNTKKFWKKNFFFPKFFFTDQYCIPRYTEHRPLYSQRLFPSNWHNEMSKEQFTHFWVFLTRGNNGNQTWEKSGRRAYSLSRRYRSTTPSSFPKKIFRRALGRGWNTVCRFGRNWYLVHAWVPETILNFWTL